MGTSKCGVFRTSCATKGERMMILRVLLVVVAITLMSAIASVDEVSAQEGSWVMPASTAEPYQMRPIECWPPNGPMDVLGKNAKWCYQRELVNIYTNGGEWFYYSPPVPYYTKRDQTGPGGVVDLGYVFQGEWRSWAPEWNTYSPYAYAFGFLWVFPED